MDNYQIRYCKLDEVDKLQDFIHTYWKNGHILSRNKELLDYQHKNVLENRYNFAVAFNKTTEQFDIILGFIPHSQYDSLYKGREIWLAIWMKNDKELPRGLGKKLLDFIEEDYQPSSIGSIGINDTIEQLYISRGWKNGILDIWYFLKPCNLISFEKSDVPESDYYFNPFHKTANYYHNRYDKHPFYKYNTFQGVIYRKIVTDKGTCLRIVDFKKHFYLDEYYLSELLAEAKADYIDCLNHGMSSELFLKMGFHKRSNKMLIPQWFEPLDLGVKEIKFAYKSDKDYFIVKGDSDQDRPTIL